VVISVFGRIQILFDPYGANYARAKIEVSEHLDGKIMVLSRGRKLRSRRLPGPTPRQDDGLRE
jgi:hypothetical protein